VRAIPERARIVVLSSMDVYRAYGSALEGRITDAVPIDERAPVREKRYPYRGKLPGRDDYDKLDVEDVFRERSATVLRLPLVYGERDYHRREEFILRRVRAKRKKIPIGAASWLWTRGYVKDIARGARLALEHPSAGEIYNLGERTTLAVRGWAQGILDAARSDAELVQVADDLVANDMEITQARGQAMLFDSTKARTMLGFVDTDPIDAIQRSVAWHLANPPTDASDDFEADDRALASQGKALATSSTRI